MRESDVKGKRGSRRGTFSLIALVGEFSVLNISDISSCTETRTEEDGNSLAQKDIMFYTMNVK